MTERGLNTLRTERRADGAVTPGESATRLTAPRSVIRWLARDPLGHLWLAAVFAVWCAVWFLWAHGVAA